MVVLEFIYNGSPVSVVPFPELDFTESSQELIKLMIKRGLVRRPGNYDRYEFHAEQSNIVWRG